MNTEPPTECVTWDLLAGEVLHQLRVDGVEAVTLELFGDPDDRGHTRLRIVPTGKADLQHQFHDTD